MTSEEVLAIFREAGAYLEGHFILTSGLRSPVFLQKARVFMHADKTEKLCRALADKIRAVPASIRRASLRVDSWLRTAPSRGNVMWRRSASHRMTPVVNRTERGARAVLNRGKPAARPARSPFRDFDHASRPWANPSRPVL